MGYTLGVGGISEADADAVAEYLIRFGAAAAPGEGRWAGCPLDGAYRYDAAEGTAFFGKAEETKWSDAEETIGELSGYYPHAVFELDTGGHEEDLSRTYFRGGRYYSVVPEIAFPEFDGSRLPGGEPEGDGGGGAGDRTGVPSEEAPSGAALSGMRVHLIREKTDDNTWYTARLVDSGRRLPICTEVQGYSGQGPDAGPERAVEALTTLLERLGLPTNFEVAGCFAEVRLPDAAKAPELDRVGAWASARNGGPTGARGYGGGG